MNFSQYVVGDALVLSKTKININKLVGFLQSNVHITQLSLRYCGISDQGAEALANGNLSHLTKLDLERNGIGKKGAEALAKGNLLNLTLLNLDSNRIGDDGKGVLAKLQKRREAETARLREMKEIPNRVRELEERHQTEITALRQDMAREIEEIEKLKEEKQNMAREMEEMRAQLMEFMTRDANQTNDQPGPSSKLDEVPLRSQSLSSLYSNGVA